jgi:release factor glutamine methyltransferase
VGKQLIRDRGELYSFFKIQLEALYPGMEATSIARAAMEHLTGLGFAGFVLTRDTLVNTAMLEDARGILDRLLNHEPLQYILGETYFFGRKFRVNPDVLIPRPETEELVALVVSENKQASPSILDLGTGSGCIAISLALEIPGSRVTGVDISLAALDIARGNALLHEVDVQWLHKDMKGICSSDFEGQLDIIVSNPPYVRNSERSVMRPNVVDHEPALALYVPDDDPLIFYRVIVGLGRELLHPGGKVQVEINEAFPTEVMALFKSGGYQEVVQTNDLSGRPRMVSATR